MLSPDIAAEPEVELAKMVEISAISGVVVARHAATSHLNTLVCYRVVADSLPDLLLLWEICIRAASFFASSPGSTGPYLT